MQLTVRINGTLPDISVLGSEDDSERASEVKNQNIFSNTSCSIFLQNETNQIFHILFDIGQGIIQSIEKGFPALGLSHCRYHLHHNCSRRRLYLQIRRHNIFPMLY